jgi:DNA-binding CsgD family transcriptional regulator
MTMASERSLGRNTSELRLLEDLCRRLRLDVLILDERNEPVLVLNRGTQILRWLNEKVGRDQVDQLVRVSKAHDVVVQRGEDATRPSFELVAFPVGSLTLLMCAGPAHPRLPTFSGLRSLYGMTPSEAYVAGALAADQSPKEIANDLGLSLSTVRSHLFAVRTKIGATSQTDLLRRLLNSAAVYGNGGVDDNT